MNHIMDILPRFQEIIEKLEQTKKGVVSQSGISDTSQDARMVALDSIQIDISSVGMWINARNSLANLHTVNGNFNENDFLMSVGSGLDANQTEEVMLNHLRLGFMTLIHFKIDNLFHNILKHLDSLPTKKGYWNLTNEILVQCGFPKTGKKKDLLTAFANLRNSLHGNGIHKTDSLNITVKDLSYHFTKGERIECASWEHIVTLLESNVEILKDILLSEKIVNIKTEINDDFAFGS